MRVSALFYSIGLPKPRMRGFRSLVHAVHALHASPQSLEPPAHAASVPTLVCTSQACAYTLEPSLRSISAHIRAPSSSFAIIIAEC